MPVDPLGPKRPLETTPSKRVGAHLCSEHGLIASAGKSHRCSDILQTDAISVRAAIRYSPSDLPNFKCRMPRGRPCFWPAANGKPSTLASPTRLVDGHGHRPHHAQWTLRSLVPSLRGGSFSRTPFPAIAGREVQRETSCKTKHTHQSNPIRHEGA